MTHFLTFWKTALCSPCPLDWKIGARNVSLVSWLLPGLRPSFFIHMSPDCLQLFWVCSSFVCLVIPLCLWVFLNVKNESFQGCMVYKDATVHERTVLMSRILWILPRTATLKGSMLCILGVLKLPTILHTPTVQDGTFSMTHTCTLARPFHYVLSKS